MMNENTPKKDENTDIPIILRLASMLLDHVFMSLIMVVIIVPFALIALQNEGNLDTVPPSLLYAMAFGYVLYFFKDAVQGRSFAKRILKFQVVDNTTGEVASPIKCVLRNLLIPLWFFEIIPALFNTNRRLGDYLAGTKLVPYNPQKHQSTLDWAQLGIAFLLAIAISSCLLSAMNQILSDMLANLPPVE